MRAVEIFKNNANLNFAQAIINNIILTMNIVALNKTTPFSKYIHSFNINIKQRNRKINKTRGGVD